MALRHLRGAVRAYVAEPGQIVMLLRVRIVATAVCSVADSVPVAPPFGRSDMPDVLVVAAQAEG